MNLAKELAKIESEIELNIFSLIMGKVHPGEPSSFSTSFEREKLYTVWMKSLVFSGNGFTVFDSDGNLVYRIDNYDSRQCRSSRVLLMDRKGNVLCTLLRKKRRVAEQWNGYKGEKVEKDRVWFGVRKTYNLFKKGCWVSCKVTMEGEKSQTSCVRIKGSKNNSDCQIVNGSGLIVAQAKRKEAAKGVLLGKDVLSLKVEFHEDHSLIMALLVVYGLLSYKI